jgi:hypothetical protein
MAGAAAAIAGVLILGPRKGKYDKDGNSKPILGANLTFSYPRNIHPMARLVWI